MTFDRWEMPEFDAGLDPSTAAAGVSVSQLEAVQKQAYEEAYALGMQEGHAAGAAETRAEAHRLQALFVLRHAEGDWTPRQRRVYFEAWQQSAKMACFGSGTSCLSKLGNRPRRRTR